MGYLQQHAAGVYLGIGEDVAQVVDRAAGHAGLIQLSHPGGRRLLEKALL